ncbi:MAG: glycosyltransferase family 1 protein [Bacteroidetes bacterium]|nr:MAG: glycosyltransferase family 1 protein [Bacteroidota bacterium]
MTKVRVLRLISRLNVGGPAHQALLLTRDLDPTRYESWLLAGQEPAGEARAVAWIEAYGVPVTYVPFLEREPSWYKDLRALWHLWRVMRQKRPHIVHTHTAKAGTLGRLAAWLAGVPVRIHTFHGHSLEGYFSPWRSWVYRQIEAWLARLTHRIVAISERQKQDLVERFRIAPPEKVVVIPLGFELERLDRYDPEKVAALRAAWQGPEEGLLLVGWIGRMVPIKRVDRLLRAFAHVKATGVPARLVLVGDGPERPALEALARTLNLEKALVWAGLQWDMASVLRALDAVVLTSDNEGTPVTLIEALACGVPVAATPVGGVPDLLEDGRWGTLLAEPLAQSLQTFLEALPQARAQAQAAQPYIRQRYGAARLLQDIDRLYRSVGPAF